MSHPQPDNVSTLHDEDVDQTAPPRGDGDEASRRGLPIWLFILLFVLAAIAIGWQLQVAGELEREIAGLESELAETKSLLNAHQTRLVEIRGGVRDLAVQLEGLQALVDAEPGSSTDARSPRESAADGAAAPPPAPRESFEIPARLTP